MSIRLKPVLIAMASVVTALFTGRLAYLKAHADQVLGEAPGLFAMGAPALEAAERFNSDAYGGAPRNYAHYELHKAPARAASALQQTAQAAGDALFEKVANLMARSRSFEQDEAKVRTVAAAEKALVQMEQSLGLAGERSLLLSIGVAPQNFDRTVESLRKVGLATYFQVDKNDRTQEVRNLIAKQEGLKKHRAALEGLRAKGGKIQEYLALQKDIQEVEEEMLGLGVTLNNYGGADLCTVRLTLRELGPVAGLVSLVLPAFYWTLGSSALGAAWLGLLTLCAYLLARVGDKIMKTKFV